MTRNTQLGEDAVSNETDTRPVFASTTGDEAVSSATEALNNLTSTRLPELSSRYQYAEAVDHPPHYGGDTTYETIKVVQAWGLGFELGTVLKHISRAGKKPNEPYLKDLEKAQYYLQAEIDRVRAQG
jgi:hypothetical protein